MTWNERQRAMLAEMGVPVTAPLAGAADEPATAEPPAAPAAVKKAPTPAALLPQPQAIIAMPGAPRASGIEQMDWSTLRDTVAGCTACKLCTGRTQTVFGAGSTQAQWLVVGEAPGEQEDRLGEPFVGKSGQLLDNMLRAIQRSRHNSQPDGQAVDAAHQVYIANTVKCRPPGNRNPEPQELAQCEPYLIRQIELLQPRIILAMGRFAVQSLLRSTEPVGRLRGRVHHFQGVPLIVTYHPAYLLRNPDDKAKAWDDLCLALQTVESLGGPPPSSTTLEPSGRYSPGN